LGDVIPPNDIGVTFDDIGALENVKDTLKELVMLPLQRPELFCKGQLTKVFFYRLTYIILFYYYVMFNSSSQISLLLFFPLPSLLLFLFC